MQNSRRGQGESRRGLLLWPLGLAWNVWEGTQWACLQVLSATGWSREVEWGMVEAGVTRKSCHPLCICFLIYDMGCHGPSKVAGKGSRQQMQNPSPEQNRMTMVTRVLLLSNLETLSASGTHL